MSGLTTFAVTVAFCVAAAAGIAQHAADQAAASASIPVPLVAIRGPAALRRAAGLATGMVDFRSTMIWLTAKEEGAAVAGDPFPTRRGRCSR